MPKYSDLEIVRPGEESVQPWLDLANLWRSQETPPELGPAPDELVNSLFEAGAVKARLVTMGTVLWDGTQAKTDAAQQFYALFFEVRRVLTELVENFERVQAETQNAPRVFPPVPVQLGGTFSTFVTIDNTGRIDFGRNRAIELFERCFRGVELRRIRRCPECGRFYYASRNNKQACDEHLTLMRVRRTRGQVGRYEESRRILSRSQIPAIKGKERARLVGLFESITSKPEVNQQTRKGEGQ